jgi:NADPH-dependent 2,4-dienoyl-CoA reductase/sulfur reductase-like enzyme/peroxiredoxin family protein/rhodanese-related sulfurtransferase/TusA-related sulfurtransferase
MKIVIVGGVAGGATTAARLRRLNEDAEIIIFEKGQYISFANCGLPYHIGEVIKKEEDLLVQTPEGMKNRFNIDVRVNSEVIKINKDKKEIEVKDVLTGKTYFEAYDKLVLSPGADPIRPPLEGIDLEHIFTLRNIPDTLNIKSYIDNNHPKKALVVGAGYIGLEMAENLHARGLEVTVVELSDHVIGPLDFDMASQVHQHLRAQGVNLILNDKVVSFKKNDGNINAELGSGKIIETDMVILGIGVRPETKLAKDVGIALGEKGGILVNEYMQTNIPDIYAVGDAIEVKDFVSGKNALIPLAGPANKQGRIAANHICQILTPYHGTQGTAIAKIFQLAVALTGNNERQLIANGIEYEKSITHSASNATYYPGATPLTIKLLFGKTDGKILGAQIVGIFGVDKRIDVIATAMRAGMTVFDLCELELSYAPPYSSAKDPVNIAGFVASNIIKGDMKVFHWDDEAIKNQENSVLIDVRTPDEFAIGSIPNAINIQVDDIRNKVDELPKDKQLNIFCQVGLRGYIANKILKQKGFTDIRNLSGGYKTWHIIAQNSNVAINDKPLPKRGLEEAGMVDNVKKDIPSIKIDACGLQCPGPIMKVFKGIQNIEPNQLLEVTATDPAFPEDIKSWCDRTGNMLVESRFDGNQNIAIIKKCQQNSPQATSSGNDKAIIVFSNDLDKIIATFILANGAAAMGRKMTLFFTFWGLNVLRKPEKVKTKKDFLAKMFGFMMPRGSKKLTLSKMSMLGIGGKLIRYLMKKKNITSLEDLIEQAKENGVILVACTMSMDIMGIKKEELIDGIQYGGVAAFLGTAETTDTNLFI